MAEFSEILRTAKPLSDGRSLTVPEGWHQGRTAYGGFTSALALAEAMRVGGEDLPPLRSAQFAMMAPLSGHIEVRARVQRRGRNATWIAAEVAGEKGVGFTASFVFMQRVENTLTSDLIARPAGVIPVEQAAPLSHPDSPEFVRHHFDVRQGASHADGEEPDILWWMRPHDHEALDPHVALLLTADGAPPSVLFQLPSRVPISTMHWHVNVLSLAPQTEDGWWLLQSRSDHADVGLSSERMTAWNTRGEPVLAELQSIAVFG